MNTDTTMTPELDMTTHAERIEMWCDLLATAPYAVQDDVPLDDLRAWIDGIRESSRALGAAWRDAEARAARLNDALLIVAAIADERGKRLSPYSPDTLSEDAQSEMGLHPGDVDKGGAA